MKLFSAFLPLFLFIFLYVPSSASDHQQGQIIVILYPGKDVNVLIRNHAGVSTLASEIRVARALSSEMNIWLLAFNPSMNENALLNSIREDENVAAAQFNYFFEERTIPNDSLFPQQWNLNNTGQQGGTAGADVDAEKAWNITTGGVTAQGDTIVIAVVDCGFDLTQPDLNFWKSGWNGDGNDTIGWCAHGTHVAGIAGARGNNRIGVTGVNWNVKIMPLDYIDVTDANVITCYSYIVQMRKLYNTTYGIEGAFIVATNSSFGINYGRPVDHPVWCAMYDSLGSVGILSAAAGPNLAIDIDSLGDMPTTCPSDWLIAVTNTTDKDTLNPSAGWGAINMDIGAPGTNILSTVPDDLYETMTGTSMASPHVAGAVALMWAAACSEMVTDYKNNPSVLASAMKTIMLNSVDTIPALENKTVSNGRLNLYKCLLGVQNYCSKYPVPKTFSYLVYPNPTVNVANIDFPTSVSFSLQMFDAVGRNVSVHLLETIVHATGQTPYSTMQIDVSGLSAGVYFIRLVNSDNSYYSYTAKLMVK